MDQSLQFALLFNFERQPCRLRVQAGPAPSPASASASAMPTPGGGGRSACGVSFRKANAPRCGFLKAYECRQAPFFFGGSAGSRLGCFCACPFVGPAFLEAKDLLSVSVDQRQVARGDPGQDFETSCLAFVLSLFFRDGDVKPSMDKGRVSL